MYNLLMFSSHVKNKKIHGKLILMTFYIAQYIQNIIILKYNQYKKSLILEESRWRSERKGRWR